MGGEATATSAPGRGSEIAERVPEVVIVGGGFGGLTAAKSLRHAAVHVTIVDRLNHHLFQPLLYQVAMAGLSPAEIAMPIRGALRDQANASVLLGEVIGVDLGKRELAVRGDGTRTLRYDFLILAAGARTTYFGHDEWAKYTIGLKDLDEALDIRRRVLLAFEAAERSTDPQRRQQLLTFVVVGGGPTGVELAGALAELSRRALVRDFRVIDPTSTRVILLEAGPRVLAAFDESLSMNALAELRKLGVDVRLGARVTEIDERGVHLGGDLIAASVVIWAAGVGASPLAGMLGAAVDRQGRVLVSDDCSVPGHPEAFAIGDMAHFKGPDGVPLPGLSPVAMQEARFVAQAIQRTVEGQPRRAFEYFDKGMMATIGRSKAVAQTGPLRLKGLIAWLAWLFIHIWYLIGFRNRVIVLIEWFWAYLTYKRGARLITGHVLDPQVPSQSVAAASKSVQTPR